MVVKDCQSLRDALRKPLEGIWNYRIEYSRFHSRTGSWQASGKAVFVWNADQARYDVQIGANVTEENKPSHVLVTFFIEGVLRADASGWPRTGSAIEGIYVARKGEDPFGEPSKPHLSYANVRIKRSPDGASGTEILAEFETGKTSGHVQFVKRV